MKKQLKYSVWAVVLLFVTLSYNACSQPSFKIIDQESESGGATGGNPMVPLATVAFTPQSSNFGFRLCLEEIRAANGGEITEVIWSGPPRYVELLPGGGVISGIEIPIGPYTLIELVATSDVCPELPTKAQFENDNGVVNYESADALVIGFFSNTPLANGKLDVSPFMNGHAGIVSSESVDNLFQSIPGNIVP
jgi:hypothetical protein